MWTLRLLDVDHENIRQRESPSTFAAAPPHVPLRDTELKCGPGRFDIRVT
jgi:hypothetical protein